jgi:hypothetical protein
MELLDDRTAHGISVFAFDDDRTAGAIDYFLHEDISTLVGPPISLADVLVAEVPENILNDILKLESREVV